MLSGKPPRPWKRKRRGVSVARIALLVLLMGSAAAYAFWRLRPIPPTWQPAGSERIVTPAIDIADAQSRDMMRWLANRRLNHYQGEWLGWACTADPPMPGDIYVLSDTHDGYRPGNPGIPVRITAVLGALGGEIVREEIERFGDEVVRRQRRSLDVDEAERFRDLLIESRYTEFAPVGRTCLDSGSVALESCVQGRYYGVLHGCGGEDASRLFRLAEAIDSFARDGAEPWPIPVPTAPAPEPATTDAPPIADAMPGPPGTD